MFLFLMNFLKVVTKKTCHTTYTKALLVKKNGPKLPYFKEKMSEFTIFILKKKVPCYSYQGFYGEKMAPSRHNWGRERPNF